MLSVRRKTFFRPWRSSPVLLHPPSPLTSRFAFSPPVIQSPLSSTSMAPGECCGAPSRGRFVSCVRVERRGRGGPPRSRSRFPECCMRGRAEGRRREGFGFASVSSLQATEGFLANEWLFLLEAVPTVFRFRLDIECVAKMRSVSSKGSLNRLILLVSKQSFSLGLKVATGRTLPALLRRKTLRESWGPKKRKRSLAA